MTAKKSSASASDVSNIQYLSQLTNELLISHFPTLRSIKSSLFVAMATWSFESGFRLLHKRGGQTTSMHYAPSVPGKGAAAYRGYYADPVIQNILARPGLSPTVKDNVYQGLVAHGLSATMGYYYVAGTKNNIAEFRDYRRLVTDLGLEVAPGAPITDLFQDNGELQKRRSIASGLIILENKLKVRLKQKMSPDAALKAACGDYLGKAGATDIFGTSPATRTAQFSNQSTISLLAQAGVTADGTTFVNNASSGTQVADASNSENRDGSGTVIAAGTLPGCTA